VTQACGCSDSCLQPARDKKTLQAYHTREIFKHNLFVWIFRVFQLFSITIAALSVCESMKGNLKEEFKFNLLRGMPFWNLIGHSIIKRL